MIILDQARYLQTSIKALRRAHDRLFHPREFDPGVLEGA